MATRDHFHDEVDDAFRISYLAFMFFNTVCFFIVTHSVLTQIFYLISLENGMDTRNIQVVCMILLFEERQ